MVPEVYPYGGVVRARGRPAVVTIAARRRLAVVTTGAGPPSVALPTPVLESRDR